MRANLQHPQAGAHQRAIGTEGSRRVHGHSYRAEVAVKGVPDKASGMIVDLGLFDQSLQKVRDAYEIKIKFEDPNALLSLERYTLLGSIDRLWQEHLYAIDALRQSISLRTIGQKDPLIEYKREAFSMFSDLMGRIKGEIASSLFRTSASITAFESFLRNLPHKLIHGR